MGSRSASGWKILIGLAVACGILVFLGGFLHRRSLEESVQKAQDASTAYVKTKLAHAVDGIDLSQPVKDATAASLTKDLNLPDGDELRIFAVTGTPVYGSPGLETFPADDEALHTAATGEPSRVIDGSDLRVYAPIVGKAQRVVGVAAVVTSYTQLRRDASGPLDDLRLPLVGLGVIFLIAGLFLMLRSTKSAAPERAAEPSPAPAAAPSKSRVTGFEPVAGSASATAATASTAEPAQTAEVPAAEPAPPTQRFGLRLGRSRDTAAASPAPDETAPEKQKRTLFGKRSAPEADGSSTGVAPRSASTSALDREVAIRQALEDQLEQLRTQVKTHEDERVNAVRELSAQLDGATRRAEAAEALVRGSGEPSGPSAPTAPAAAEQIAALEQELARAKAAAADAIARADDVQRAAAAAPVAPTPDPGAEQRVAEIAAQLLDAQQRATSAEQRAASAEQRAASVGSVRDELEVRVAQLGAKTGEVEQRASELETKLNEANAGGDAVRAEIATLTAALTSANARVHELESATPASADQDADRAEIARLRGELAKQMERAQAAEDRIATLEADVAAATRGVTSMMTEHAPSEAPTPEHRPIEERAPQQHTPPTVAPATAPEPAPVNRPSEPVQARADAVPPAPAGDDRYDDMWTAPFSAPSETPAAEPARPAEPTQNQPEPQTSQAAEADRETPPAAEPTPPVAAEDEAPATEETELSPDDMWSLRARLADAAARKRQHHIQ